MKQIFFTGGLGLAVRKNNSKIEYLLTQRFAPQSPDWHLKWQIPGGGIEFGEHPKETVIREIKEELDITPTIIYDLPIVEIATRIKPDRQVHITLVCYLIDIGDQKITISDPDHETGEFGWFSLDEIKKLEYISNTIKFVEQAEKILIENDIL